MLLVVRLGWEGVVELTSDFFDDASEHGGRGCVRASTCSEVKAFGREASGCEGEVSDDMDCKGWAGREVV